MELFWYFISSQNESNTNYYKVLRINESEVTIPGSYALVDTYVYF